MISMINWVSMHNDICVPNVYIHSTDLHKKYFSYGMGENGLFGFHCDNVIHQDMLVTSAVFYAKLVIFDNNMQGLTLSPHQTFNNYQKDIWSYKNFDMSYEQHIRKVIDELCDNIESPKSNNQINRGHSVALNLHDDCYQIIDTQGESRDEMHHNPQLGTGSATKLSNSTDKRVVSDVLFPEKKTGYIALEYNDDPFIGPDREEIDIDNIDTCLRIANIIKNTNQPNYKCARFPIKSGLNIKAWDQHLMDYPDKHILQYLKFGFPLSLNDKTRLNSQHVTNHYSALAYPEAVTEYLLKEVGLGAMLGPFDTIDSTDIHCSPLLTRPKDFDKRRVILDLSYPKGTSLNDFVTRSSFDGDDFALKLTSIDNIMDDIRNTEDPMLFKVDVARALRNLCVDPADCIKLGIKWNDQYFIDKAIAFGWVHGTAAFQLCSDVIAFIIKTRGITLHCYIDDYIGVLLRDKAQNAFEQLCSLLENLGLPMNSEKLTPPTKRLTCLGIEVDIDQNIMRIQPDKLQEIYAECLKVKSKKSLSRKAFQSLLGRLLYIKKCVIPSRTFINRILALFRSSPGQRIHLNREFYQDIDWFLRFLPIYNGISCINKVPIQEQETLYLDACLTGLGAVWQNRVYATPRYDIVGFDLNTTHLEMLNLVVAIKVWGKFWKNSSVIIYCDNMSVVQVVQTSRTRDPFLALCIRNIWFLRACYDIELEVRHVIGRENIIADTLSRIYSEKQINQQVLQYLEDNFIWDEVPYQTFDLDLSL